VIYGIGTDIVEVERLRASHRRFGRRLLQRLLHPHEVAECLALKSPAHYLAKRLAAKEALGKAGGMPAGLGLREVRVAHLPQGRPVLHCEGRTAELLRSLGICATHLSLSDERHYVVATVVLTVGRPC